MNRSFFKDGPLEKLWGWRGDVEFSSPCMNIFRPAHQCFLGGSYLACIILFRLISPCTKFFWYSPNPPLRRPRLTTWLDIQNTSVHQTRCFWSPCLKSLKTHFKRTFLALVLPEMLLALHPLPPLC